PLGGAKQRALLALLVLDAGQVVPRERLIDALWAESPPPSAVKGIQLYVWQLRKLLPEGTIVTRPAGYALEADPEAIDLRRGVRRRAGGARGGGAGGARSGAGPAARRVRRRGVPARRGRPPRRAAADGARGEDRSGARARPPHPTRWGAGEAGGRTPAPRA